MTTYPNATRAFVGKLDEVLRTGETLEVRGQTVRELRAQLVQIAAPLERVYLLPARNNNIFAAIAETLWVVGGRNDIGYLSHYLPRAADFSDDGLTWRAGYGPRLRDWQGVDQVHETARLLGADLHTRRAVMVIFDPARDYAESKDIPCNNWLQWLIRDGRLDLHVAVRSNDIVWGFSGINTFEWSVLHQMMAHWTDTQVGSASYFIGSLHLYDRHFSRAEQIVARAGPRTLYDYGFATPRFATPLAALDGTLARWFAAEQRLRESGGTAEVDVASFDDDFLRTCLHMLAIYNRYRASAAPDEVARLVEALPPCDFKVAAIEYFARTFKDRTLIRLSEPERAFFDGYWAR